MGSERPANNIVFVVAESLRGDHLSLNGYERKTTPFLDDLSERGLIHNWGIAVSNSTCSIVSHDMLLTGFRPDELPDRDESLKKVPLIFQYAKAMGYKTFYMDAQMDSIWGEMEGDGISYVDERYNSSFFYRKVKNGRDIDFEIAKSIDRITSSSSGNFIFVFKRGVHFPYKNSFPEEAAVWKPSFDGSPVDASPEEQAAVINSYDNGIRYNLEGFFKNLTRDYNNLPNNTVYIYTGDHGQTLGDYGVNYPHCGVTKSEAIVPLFIIGNLQGEVDTKFKASHENIFATILDLMKYPDDLRKRNYAISLLKAKESDSKPRHYASSGRSTLGEHIPSGKLKFD
ncbi:MAG: sulfatase-like hydrolase/transferase [Pyrinomonadaceae bacterium]